MEVKAAAAGCIPLKISTTVEKEEHTEDSQTSGRLCICGQAAKTYQVYPVEPALSREYGWTGDFSGIRYDRQTAAAIWRRMEDSVPLAGRREGGQVVYGPLPSGLYLVRQMQGACPKGQGPMLVELGMGECVSIEPKTEIVRGTGPEPFREALIPTGDAAEPRLAIAGGLCLISLWTLFFTLNLRKN